MRAVYVDDTFLHACQTMTQAATKTQREEHLDTLTCSPCPSLDPLCITVHVANTHSPCTANNAHPPEAHLCPLQVNSEAVEEV